MKKQSQWQMVLAVCIFVIVTANLFVAIRISKDTRKLQLLPQRRQSLPCGAIPTRYVIEEPVCANKLLTAMNITNVHIVPHNESRLVQNEHTIPWLNSSATR